MKRSQRLLPRLLLAGGLLFSLAGGLLSLACRGPELPPLEPLVHPDPASADDAVRRQLGEARAALDKAVAAGQSAPAAAAFGKLGELYLAYQFNTPAGVCLRNAEKLDPASFVWPYEQGLLAAAAGDRAAARGHFERALAKNPGYAPAQAHLAENALLEGDAVGARALLAPLESKADYAAFRDAVAAGKTGAAFPDPLRASIAELVRSSGSLLERGREALRAGRLVDAEAAFRRAVSGSPDQAEPRLALADVLARQGRPADAVAALEEARSRRGDDPAVRRELGVLYRSQGRADAALAELNEALRLAPGDAAARLELAATLAQLERWNEAAPAVAAALEKNPRDRRARLLEARVLKGRGQAPAALDRLRVLVAEDPADAAARDLLTEALAAGGKTAEAIELYRQAAKLPATSKEDAVRLYDDAAKLAWRQNQRDQSVLLWRQAIERDPASPQAHLNLGNGLQLLNRREEAEAELAKAVELDPKDSNARLTLASLRILMGRFGQARELLEAGLTLEPNHPAMLNTLARLLATCPESANRDGRRALELAQRAFGLEARLEHAETVGMALAEMGQFEQAIRWQRGLAQQAQQRGDRAALTRLVGTLRSFEQRQPIRATLKP